MATDEPSSASTCDLRCPPSPPVEGRYVCPLCLTARDEPGPCKRCPFPEEPVDRQEPGKDAGPVAAVGQARLVDWIGGLSSAFVLVVWCLCRLAVGRPRPLEPADGVLLAVIVLLGLVTSVATVVKRKSLPREIRVDDEGVEQIGPGSARLRLAWSEVTACHLLSPQDGVEELHVSDGARGVRLWHSLRGYDAAKRAVLARTPVVTPVSVLFRPMSRKAQWVVLLVLVAVVVATALAVWWCMKRL